MTPDAEAARKAALDIIAQGERAGVDGKDLIDAGNGLLDMLSEQESGGGGEGEPGGEKDESGEGEGGGDGGAEGEEPGTTEGGEIEEPGTTEGGEIEGLKEILDTLLKESVERGQPGGDRLPEVDERDQTMNRRHRVTERSAKGGKLPGWALVVAHGHSAGPLLEVHLDPEPDYYLSSAHELTEEIGKSRRLLAQIVLPTVERRTFEKAGRFMVRKMTQFYAESHSKSLERMYEIDRMKLKNELPAVAVCIDVSGSFVPFQPGFHMVHLAEVFRRFQPSGRFALYTFGEQWARVKGFDEPWSTMDRIGDFRTKIGGGTETDNALKAAYKDISLVAARHKVVLLISDFFFESRPDYFGGLADLMIDARWGGIHTVPIQAGTFSDKQMIYFLPRRQLFFRITDYSEVTKALLTYLTSVFKGVPPKGAFFTPDSVKGSCYQVPG